MFWNYTVIISQRNPFGKGFGEIDRYVKNISANI